MKKILYITLFIVGSLVASCDNDNGAYYPVPSNFSVSPTTVQSVDANGGTVELTINAGNLGWWIESSQTWCTVSKKYGSGDMKVTVTIDPNITGSERQGEIAVNPTFNQEPVKIAINQQ